MNELFKNFKQFTTLETTVPQYLVIGFCMNGFMGETGNLSGKSQTQKNLPFGT
ncbi:hypothetical protein Mpal_2494 [Methanosphaerula palustris E1-9c]|uniref:Uncharacterized protein n=1 Tax=Methanosphaerula palustris (strain ATCC BAA-1556 / DSM 19958 / E1-9c) TaxID=521011 RepID=B8GER8_METPE|nr:hypothetical protein Mpal_2494 [Methanosphaerula palustris E1-9c]